MNRRRFLRASGALLGLPALGHAAELKAPRRLLAIHVPLGMMPQFYEPGADGHSPYLHLLAKQRQHFTSFSGLSHPGVDGNHHAGQCFLTGAVHPGQPSFRNSISLDQWVAERIGLDTRFSSLQLSVSKGDHYGDGIAISRSAVMLPTEKSPANLYRRLFVPGSAEEKAAALRRIQAGGSVLDLLLGKIKTLEKSSDAQDKARLDQYFQSLRELEGRLQGNLAWENRPKPKVNYAAPKDIADANEVIARSQLMFDLLRLALQTDSTRVVTLSLSTFSVVPHVPGVKSETHSLTHHGNEPEKIAELRRIEEAQLLAFGRLLEDFAAVREGASSLLDHTQILYGSCLGNANSHSNQNLPILLAGGGFRHGQHLKFDAANNTPLANLYVSMLQGLGLEADRFASSSGTLRGLSHT